MLEYLRGRIGPGGNRHDDGKRSGAATDPCATKIYEGGRGLGGAVVTVDDVSLDPRFNIRQFSRTGFEWTYEGAGPCQLALALLTEHLGDPARALAMSEAFMRAVVAELDNAWRLTSAQIDAALQRL